MMASEGGDLLSQFELKGVQEIKKNGPNDIKAGSYGFVFDVMLEGVVFIAKKPHTIFMTESTPEERERVAAKFREECILLSQLHHPNIVRFIGVYYGDARKSDLILVMEKLKYDLVHFLADNSQPDLSLKLSILRDVASGLVYLHQRSPPVVHRDLTAMNVLLTINNQAKITDVGVAKLMDNRAMMASRHTRVPGQMFYMPPETLFEKPLCTPKLDVFSFGHLTLHLIIGNFPEVFEIPHNERKEGVVEHQKRKRSLKVMGNSHCLYDLTINCLKDDLNLRPNAQHLLEYLDSRAPKKQEVIEEVEMEDSIVRELLRNSSQYLEQDYLNRGLIAATKNDSHLDIGKMVVKGANNFDECLAFAVREKKPHACAMLLLIKAAFTGNHTIVQMLFGETVDNVESLGDQFSHPGFDDVQKTVLSGRVATVVPIDIAQRNGHLQVREELLLKTNVNQEEGYVSWHELRLLQLEVSWLLRISWVKVLRLAKNVFKTLPNDMGNYLKQVVKLDLRHNELTVIPNCLLKLPKLEELNLAHNTLQEIPDIPEWSAYLRVLNLSHNQLSTLPYKVLAPAIASLDISHNKFRTVPLCICSFVTLISLNLSNNPDIQTLPKEMGRLCTLFDLNLTNLQSLKDPPKNIQTDTKECIRYLNSKLWYAKQFYRMKLMVVGRANQGKTTLVQQLLGIKYSIEATIGVEVSEWRYKPSFIRKPFLFSIWDFSGQEEYCAPYFFTQNTLYLLVFNLKDGDYGMQRLKTWLNTIAWRAPQSSIIIIGTHLDEVKEEKREEIDALLQRVGILAESYSSKLQIVEIIPVGLKNKVENVFLLKNSIYSYAANYKTKSGRVIMGQKIPASYHALNKKLESIQQEVWLGIREPIMHKKEFNTMVQQMNLGDIQDEDELQMVTLFLNDIGSLLHYDDHSHDLHELYFIDPCWLYTIISNFVTTREIIPFVKKGILCSKYIPLLFKDNNFLWKYCEQFLALLDHFEIALPLDNRRMLIPCMLPDDKPMKWRENTFPRADPVYSRYIMFNSMETPPGFWGRLLSKIMYSIPQISSALDQTTLSSLVEEQVSDGSDKITTVKPDLEGKETATATQVMPEPQNPSILNVISQSEAPPAELSSTRLNPQSCQVCQENQDIQPSLISSKIISTTTKFEKAEPNLPQLIPNFPSSLPNIVEQFNTKELCLETWRCGLFYKDPQVSFHIESLAKSGMLHQDKNDGVLIVTSYSNHGKKIIGQLIDLVLSLICEWYPGLTESPHSYYNLEQRVPCFECRKAKIPMPFEFQVNQFLPNITKNQTTIGCGYGHTVPLVDIVPDLLLQDIDPQFLLDPDDIHYQEDDASLLGKGGYGKVYHGTYCNKSVAIKKYLTRDEEAFMELRSEAMLLQQFKHPCLVCLVGVSINPKMILVLEEAPCKYLDYFLLKRKTPIDRVTIFRIAAEVAAALSYLHKQGIIFRNLNSANILVWTLEPTSLCHCKITNFGIATYRAPVGARGLQGYKGFFAPEILHIGKRKQRSVDDHKVDIYSFGMLLYEVIARRHPFHDAPAHRIDVLVEKGLRPKLRDVDIAHTGYHYLTMLMKKCWEDSPKNRPEADTIIEIASKSAVQSVMCVFPVKRKLPQQAIALTSANLIKAGVKNITHNELWVCCNGVEGLEMIIYNINTMMMVSKNFIKENQVQCMTFCNNHVWVASHAGIEYSTIELFDITTKTLVHNIRIKDNSVSCLVAAGDNVLVGTLEGYCFSFSSDIERVRQNARPRYKYISEYAVNSIVSVADSIWVSYTQYIYFLNRQELNLEGFIRRDRNIKAFIGQLSLAPTKDVVWSAHLGGIIVSAWDTNNRIHMFDIDTSKALQKIAEDVKEHNMVITAMVPVLDMTWVGMATGHILLFHNEELLTWYHPYSEFVRFLTVIPGSGPCEKEDCMVVSGGKGFISLLQNMGPDYDKTDEKGEPLDEAGVLVIWEGYNSKTIQQIKLVDNTAPHHLETHSSVRQLIQTGNFLDSTNVVCEV